MLKPRATNAYMPPSAKPLKTACRIATMSAFLASELKAVFRAAL